MRRGLRRSLGGAGKTTSVIHKESTSSIGFTRKENGNALFQASTLAMVAIAFALTACSGKSWSSQQSNTTTSTEATAPQRGTTAAASSDRCDGFRSEYRAERAAASGPVPGLSGRHAAQPDQPVKRIDADARDGPSARDTRLVRQSLRLVSGRDPGGIGTRTLTQPSPTALFVTIDANKNRSRSTSL